MKETIYAVENVWKCRKKKEYEVLNEVFDITLLKGNWLSSEDKEFCYLKVDNKGAMGYSTDKIAVPSNSCLQVFQKEYFPLTNFQKIPSLRILVYWPKIPTRWFQWIEGNAETIKKPSNTLQRHRNPDPSVLDIPIEVINVLNAQLK